MTTYVRHPQDPLAATQPVPPRADQDALRKANGLFGPAGPLVTVACAGAMLWLFTQPIQPRSEGTYGEMIDSTINSVAHDMQVVIVVALSAILALSVLLFEYRLYRGLRQARRRREILASGQPITFLDGLTPHHVPAMKAIEHLAAMQSLRSWSEVCEPAERAKANVEVAALANRCDRLDRLACHYDPQPIPSDRLDRLKDIEAALHARARALGGLLKALQDADRSLAMNSATPTVEALDHDLRALHAETVGRPLRPTGANTNEARSRDAHRRAVVTALGAIGRTEPDRSDH